MAKTRHHDAICTACDQKYKQLQTEDCMDVRTGQSVGGYDGNYWYGYNRFGDLITYKDPQNDPRVTLRWLNVYPYGGPYDCCPACTIRLSHKRAESDYYDSDLAPMDFDPSYAGESWE